MLVVVPYFPTHFLKFQSSLVLLISCSFTVFIFFLHAKFQLQRKRIKLNVGMKYNSYLQLPEVLNYLHKMSFLSLVTAAAEIEIFWEQAGVPEQGAAGVFVPFSLSCAFGKLYQGLL